jgi:uncharacterized protein YjbJ (UPF0337 family)
VVRFGLREAGMNKDQLKGKLENLKGRAKQAAGSLSGHKETEAEGAVDRIAGAAREKVGDAEEAISSRRRKIDDDDSDEDKE